MFKKCVTDARASGDKKGSLILSRSKPSGKVGGVEEEEEAVAVVSLGVVVDARLADGPC